MSVADLLSFNNYRLQSNLSVGTLNATGVITAALVKNGLITSAPAGGQTFTFDSAANIIGLVSNPYVGQVIEYQHVNTSANAATIASPGATVVITGLASTSLAANASRNFIIVFTNVTAGTLAVAVYG